MWDYQQPKRSRMRRNGKDPTGKIYAAKRRIRKARAAGKSLLPEKHNVGRILALDLTHREPPPVTLPRLSFMDPEPYRRIMDGFATWQAD